MSQGERGKLESSFQVKVMGPRHSSGRQDGQGPFGRLVWRAVARSVMRVCESGEENLPLFCHFLYFNMEEGGWAGRNGPAPVLCWGRVRVGCGRWMCTARDSLMGMRFADLVLFAPPSVRWDKGSYWKPPFYRRWDSGSKKVCHSLTAHRQMVEVGFSLRFVKLQDFPLVIINTGS